MSETYRSAHTEQFPSGRGFVEHDGDVSVPDDVRDLDGYVREDLPETDYQPSHPAAQAKDEAETEPKGRPRMPWDDDRTPYDDAAPSGVIGELRREAHEGPVEKGPTAAGRAAVALAHRLTTDGRIRAIQNDPSIPASKKPGLVILEQARGTAREELNKRPS